VEAGDGGRAGRHEGQGPGERVGPGRSGDLELPTDDGGGEVDGGPGQGILQAGELEGLAAAEIVGGVGQGPGQGLEAGDGCS
jgi:hypothetical protein